MIKKVIVLTPRYAGELLATNYDGQRRLNNAYAASIARDITAGKWNGNMVNQAIIVSDTGKLLDGQHRCKACIIANKPIKTEIIYGCPEEWFSMIDANKSRNVRDFIKTKNAVIVAGIARFATGIDNGMTIYNASFGSVGYIGDRKIGATRTEVLEKVNENSELYEELAYLGVKIYESVHGGSKNAFANALYLIGYINDFENLDEIRSFVEEIQADITLSEAIAQGKRIAIKNIIEAKNKGMSIKGIEFLALTLAMWSGYINNKKMPVRKWKDVTLSSYDKVIKKKQERGSRWNTR